MKKQHEANDRFVVIMAGGRGERFWPVSRQKTPKQLITLLGGRSFLQQAFDRVRAMIPARNVFVITNAVQAPEARRQLPQLPKENVVGEPLGRDTCAAVALGAALVGARSRTGVMAMFPADHVIPDGIGFRRVLGEAFQVAERTTAMITIGIQPTEPATGYGYIEMGDPLPSPEDPPRVKPHSIVPFDSSRNRISNAPRRTLKSWPLPLECGYVHLVLPDSHRRIGSAST